MTPNHLALSLLRQLETEHREITERIIEFKRLFKLEDWDTGFVSKEGLSQALHNSRKIVASYMGEGESLVDELIEERREEARKEEEGIQLSNKWQQVINPERDGTSNEKIRALILQVIREETTLSTQELGSILISRGVHRVGIKRSKLVNFIGLQANYLKSKRKLMGNAEGWELK